MAIKKIDKNPPTPTGDVKADIAALQSYLVYLREQINFALSQIDREGK